MGTDIVRIFLRVMPGSLSRATSYAVASVAGATAVTEHVGVLLPSERDERELGEAAFDCWAANMVAAIAVRLHRYNVARVGAVTVARHKVAEDNVEPYLQAMQRAIDDGFLGDELTALRAAAGSHALPEPPCPPPA